VKARYIALLLSTTLLTLPGFAKQSKEMQSQSKDNQENAMQTPYIEYNNRMTVFDPGWISYERTKNDSLYWGLMENISPAIGRKKHRWLLEAEGRIGWNLFYDMKMHVTPYVGVLYLNDFRGTRCFRTSRDGVLAGEIGLLFDYEFGSVFNLGINAKGFVGGSLNDHPVWGKGVAGGGEIGIPFTFRFGGSRHWDLRIEPFDLYIRGKKHGHNYACIRAAFGYRF
jgi:hypothetical protein